MRAAVIEAFGKPLAVRELPDRVPGPGEVWMRVNACGVCHSDLHLALGDWRCELPRIPGHEAAGVVEAVGPEVHNLRVGDRIGVGWLYSACGDCEHCFAGWETVCAGQKGTAQDADGGFASHMIAAAPWVARIPENLPDEVAAPVLCGGVTAYKALRVAGVRAGETVAVFGTGGLGHFAIQFARVMGARVVAFDLWDYALKLAADVGAHEVVDLRETPVEKARELYGPAHAALPFTPAPQAARDALAMLGIRGRFVQVGVAEGSLEVPVDSLFQGVTVAGSNVGTRNDLAEALALVARGDVKPVIRTRPLADINDIFAEMHAGRLTTGRYVLTM